MDALSIINNNQALYHLSKAVIYMNNDDSELIYSIINKYKDVIDKHNKSTLSIINPTKSELNKVSYSFKKAVIKNFSLQKPKTEEFNFSKRWNDCGCCYNNEFCNECKIESIDYEKHYQKNELILKPYYDRISNLISACEKTKLSDEVVGAKILLIRKYGQYHNYDKLAIETNECIKQMMLEEFIEQNKEFKLNK